MYPNYDAFVIVHGEDTLAYTASALSFMLENLAKPVIVTDDSVENVQNSIRLASGPRFSEVVVAVNGDIHRGTRATKNGFHDFQSPHAVLVGEGSTIDKLVVDRTIHESDMDLVPIDPEIQIALIKVFPGITGEYVTNVLADKRVKGVVLETYRTGEFPSDDSFIKSVFDGVNDGVIFVNVSVDAVPNPEGLQDIGVLDGHDMTVEAAIAKLQFLISTSEIPQALISQPMRGEMTRADTLIRDVIRPAADPVNGISDLGQII